MTDPMELVGRLEAYRPRNEWGDPVHHVIIDEAAACIREMVNFVPPISLDGPNLPDDHRVWLARQLLDSKLNDAEAYSIVRHSPAITGLPPAPGAEDE